MWGPGPMSRSHLDPTRLGHAKPLLLRVCPQTVGLAHLARRSPSVPEPVSEVRVRNSCRKMAQFHGQG
jgi:hypothetical protein